MTIKIPASELSNAQWLAWKDGLLSYIAFQIERALSKKMDRNLGKTVVLPVLPKTTALIQPINDVPVKLQRRKNKISNRWIRL